LLKAYWGVVVVVVVVVIIELHINLNKTVIKMTVCRQRRKKGRRENRK
jgi:hypothetical protein